MLNRSDERARSRADERYATATPDRRYSALFQNLTNGIAHCRIITDLNNQPINYEIVEVNHAYELITGLKKADVEGELATEVFPGIEHASFDYIGTYGRIALEGGEASFEIFVEFLQKWLSVFVYSPARGEFVVLFNDISDRKKAEEALRGSEERLLLALEAGRVGTFEYNPQTRDLFMGERMRMLWSVPPEAKVSYEWLIGLVHPDDRQRVNDAISEALRPDSPGQYDAEYRVVWPDGSVHWGVGRGRAFFEGEVHERRAVRLVGVHFDITERKRAEEALRESEARERARAAQLEVANRTLRAHAHSDQALLLATDERSYLREVCSIIVEDCGYSMVWVGFREENENKTVRPAAYAGFEEGYLESQKITWADDEWGRGPTGTAVRTGRIAMSRDIATDPSLAPWREQARRRGFASSISLPLAADGSTFGALTIYSGQRDAFSDDEVKLLSELTSDFSYGINVLRLRAAHARSEQSLRESEERFRTLADNISQFAWMTDAKGSTFWYNRRWYEYTGTTFEEMQGWGWQKVQHPDHVERVVKKVKHSFETGEDWEDVFPLRGRDGSYRWFLSRAVPIRDAEGRVVRWLGTNTDITERLEAEQRLRRSEREFRELADSMPQLVWIADATGSLTYVNRQLYTQLGLSEEVPLGDGWLRVLHPQDRERVAQIWRRHVETGQPYETEYRLLPASGDYRWFLARGVPIRDDQGRITRWFGTSTDIDDSKRAEEHLRQAQKLESIGVLAGGIAHDFNNLLTGIIGNASLALDEGSASIAAQRMREVIRSAERGANLTRQLLAYSGKGQFIVSDIDVSQAVNDIADLVQFSIPKSVELVLNVRRRLPVVRMDPSQLQQVLMNLVINAGEAIGEGKAGTVTVSTAVARFEEPFVDAIGQQVKPGSYVCIEVSDTGSGIDEEQRSRIFDPFYTTKFTGRGLGLAAVAGIVRVQKGAITVTSEMGRGSTFSVYLPVADTGAETAADESAANGRQTVLVIDDDHDVRNVIGTVLRREGYRVLLAGDGPAALAISSREKGKIDAVVLDITMRAMCAKDVLPELTARRPDAKILLTSGYSEAEARRLCAAYPGAAFVQKPYTAQQIAAELKRLLEK